MIDGVADQMRERVFDGFKERLVEFGFLAFDGQKNLLAARHGKIADLARELIEDIAYRLHPRFHDAFLKLRGDLVEALRGVQEGRVAARGGELQNLIAGQNEFAHQVHQLVEQAHVHADVGVGHADGLAIVSQGFFGNGGRERGRRLARAVAQLHHTDDHRRVIASTFLPIVFDVFENRPNRVHQR